MSDRVLRSVVEENSANVKLVAEMKARMQAMRIMMEEMATAIMQAGFDEDGLDSDQALEILDKAKAEFGIDPFPKQDEGAFE